MTNFRWIICIMLFAATTVNYLDRQVLSLTWKDFIAPEFHWTDENYGDITGWFSLLYAVCMLFAGRFVDWLDSKKGYLWSIGIWSLAACLHALCGVATRWWCGIDSVTGMIDAGSSAALMIATVSVYFFIAARFLLALGEAGNFPAAIKVTAEYFPKKDRAFATSIFNAGASAGALLAPVCIPSVARYFQSIGFGNGWEMAFIIIGALGFIWMGFWVFLYKKPQEQPKSRLNDAELAYIEQDKQDGPVSTEDKSVVKKEKAISFLTCFTFKQTWAFAFGKFMTDGVWWFYLFWTPAYLKDVYGLSSDNPTAMILIFVLYAITMLSIYGGYLPSIFIKNGMNPYAGRMRAMLIFAFFPLLALVAQPLGSFSYWFPVIIIGIAGAAHQSWSANIFSTIGDMFPKSTIATITGIGGMAGGLGSFFIQKCAGSLFVYSDTVQLHLFSFVGKESGYFLMFCFCGIAYLIGWVVMKLLVPRYKPIDVK